jgi:hypothetical protein
MDEALRVLAASITKEICALERCQSATTADFQVRYLAVVEPYGNEPWSVRAALPQFFDSQHKLFILVTLVACETCTREAGNKDKGILPDRAPDFRSPVMAWPQIGSIPPYRYSSRLKHLLQGINMSSVLPDIGDERVPNVPARSIHNRQPIRHAEST